MTISLRTHLVLSLFLGGCAMRHDERLLAVGGVHALEATEPCHLSRVEPSSAFEDQHWKDARVVKAISEGTADLACGDHRARLVAVNAERLDLVLVEERVTVGQRFHVRAIARDKGGRELEIGKWTELAWRAEPPIVPDNDRSAGEFALGGGAFGATGFRATTPTPSTVEVRLGDATGTLRVTAQR